MVTTTGGVRNDTPTWSPEQVKDKVLELIGKGLTIPEISGIIGKGPGFIRKMIDDDDTLFYTSREQRFWTDRKVEESLYMRAIGYEIEEERVVIIQGEATTVTIKRNVLPDPKAAELWLRCRQPQTWNPNVVVEHQHSGDVGMNHKVEVVVYIPKNSRESERFTKVVEMPSLPSTDATQSVASETITSSQTVTPSTPTAIDAATTSKE